MRNIFNLIKKIFVKPKTYTLKELSDMHIKKLREEGAVIGQNVDLINAGIEDSLPFLIKIGNNVTITNATILTHDASTVKPLGINKIGSVTIGDDVFIGINSLILPNTKIGNKVIVGAGCVVAKDIPDNSVVIGNPARIVCSYDDYVDKMKEKEREYGVIEFDTEEFFLGVREKEKEKLLLDGFGFVRVKKIGGGK